jgi:hypothetical protein
MAVASRVRSIVAVSIMAGMFVLPAVPPAGAANPCDPLVNNVKTNTLRLKVNGVPVVEYHVTVGWCTAPNKSVAARVYSPRRSTGHRVTTAGLMAGWRFDRVLDEQRSYYTYKNVQYGGYSVKTRVNFLRCTIVIVSVCTNKSGWLNTYVRYDRTSAAARGWN